MAKNRPVIFIFGQTASGKASLSHHTALQTGAEIISVDSMKIYRGMDIGTAKPSRQRRAEVKYHMIDVIDPDIDINVKWYYDRVNTILHENPDTKFILSGGSAMYVKVLLTGVFDEAPNDSKVRDRLLSRAAEVGLDQLHREMAEIDPDAGDRINPNDEKRIVRALEVYELTGKPITEFQNHFDTYRDDIDFTLIGIRHPRERLYKRINERVDRMYELGLPEEVKTLWEKKAFGVTSSKAIGYSLIIRALENGEDYASDLIRERIQGQTRRFSRKQMTWYQNFENVNWIDVREDDTAESIYEQITPLLKDTWS